MFSRLLSRFRRAPTLYAPSLDDLERFVRVGCVSFEEWATLPEPVRALLDAAAGRVDAARAVQLAAALGGAVGLAAVAAELDEGEALVGLQLQGLADRALRGVA